MEPDPTWPAVELVSAPPPPRPGFGQERFDVAAFMKKLRRRCSGTESMVKAVNDDDELFRLAAEAMTLGHRVWNRLVNALQEAGVSMRAIQPLERAVRQEVGVFSGGGQEWTQSETLIALAEEANFFHDGAGGAYADIRVLDGAGDDGGEHRETHPVHSRAFRHWLGAR
jgi:hypothetical protein